MSLGVENVKLEIVLQEVGGMPVVDVSGAIDVYSAPELESAINKAIGSGAGNLIVDLADVSYMDSSGFGILLGAAKRLRPKGGRVALVRCTQAIKRILRITCLEPMLAVFSDLQEAVDSLQRQ